MSFTFQLFSDIHLEFNKTYPKITPLSDYLFLAGDIGIITYDNFEYFFDYCSKNWKKVFYVLGNHEYYNKKTYNIMNEKYKYFFEKYDNIYLLDNSYYELDEIVIIGSTLWSEITDTFDLNDFTKIHEYDETKKRKYGLSKDTFNKLHSESVDFLIETINKFDKKIIIMTHFPPIREMTSDPKYEDQSENIKNYFASDILLDTKINKKNIICWIFGHTHYSTDFKLNKIRLISNQLGYTEEKCKFNFDGIFTV
jgi:predicted phosphohydrolase